MDEKSHSVMAKGLLERIGLEMGEFTHKWNGQKHYEQLPIPNHTEGIKIVLQALTNKEYGVISAGILSKIPEDLSEIQNYTVSHEILSEVSCKEALEKRPEEEKYHVVLMDFGAKNNISEELRKRGCRVTTVPFDTSAEGILAMNPDGIMLSNGPGDPADNTGVISEIAKLLGKKPMFGICLGHQMTALAAGAKTYKLKYGHRGANPGSPPRTMAMPWIHRHFLLSRRSVFSIPMTAPVKAWTIRNINVLPCSSIRKPVPVPKTPDFCSTALLP